MAQTNISQMVLEAWDFVTTLRGYGWSPLTIGWYKGQAYIYIWDYKKGHMDWREFKTSRPEQPNPKKSPFNSDSLFYSLLSKKK